MVLIALGGFIPFTLLLFAFFPARVALISAYVLGWLFLPVADYKLWDLFVYNKYTAIAVLSFVGVLLFDVGRFARLRLTAYDLPILAWCVAAPFASSFMNDLGTKDGFSESLYQTLTWGLPYLMGRLYFGSQNGIKALAVGMFVGGLLYLPFVLYEVRMSPQLHRQVYGFLQHDWLQLQRSGGYRPMVFMHHGLMVALWMATASLCGAALWWTGALKRLWGIPMKYLVPPLMITTVLCKSLGALVLMAGGVAAVLVCKRFRTSLPVYAMLLGPVLYMGLRAPNVWDGKNLVHFIESNVAEQRAESLDFRFDAENKLAAHAMKRPVFGWGGWGRNFVKRYADDPESEEMVTVDGLWIIAFGKHGLFGLIGLTLSVLLPGLAMARRVPVRRWTEKRFVPAGVLALILILYMIDNLLNAMVNPFYMLIAGGLTTYALPQGSERQQTIKVLKAKRTPPTPSAHAV